MKKFLAIGMAAVMVFALSACSQSDTNDNSGPQAGTSAETAGADGAGSGEAAENSEEIPDFPAGDVSGLKIGFAYRHGSYDTYMTSYYKHAAAYAQEKGLNLILLDAVDDVTKQTTQVQDLIQQQCDVIIIWPVNSEVSAAQAMQVNAAGIPCMTAGTDLIEDGAQYTSCFVGHSNYQEGYDAAADAVAEMAANGITNPRVLYVDGNSGYTSYVERKAGMKAAVEEAGGTFLDEQYCDGIREKAQQVTENWLVKYKTGDFDCIMCYDANGAVGVYNAAKAAGRDGEFPIYAAVTGDPSIIKDYVSPGLLGYMALESPVTDAEAVINMAANLAMGYKPAQHNYYIDTVIINKDNAEEYKESWGE